MSIERYERIPELTLGWRLKMSLGDMSRDDIAIEMDVSPSTISRWMADQGAPPKRPYLLRWALLTGVDQDWLLGGVVNPSPDPNGGSSSRDADVDQLARLTERKRTSAGRGHTRQYVPAACAA